MPTERRESMASRARRELQDELARFWKESVKNGRQPWNDRPIVDFARFAVWIRGEFVGAQETITEAETNMLLSRLLVRFGEYLEVREQVALFHQAELAALGPPDVVLTRSRRTVPVIPPPAPGGYTGDQALVAELARATEAMRRRGR